MFKVQTSDWLLIPLDTPHQPKPASGGFSHMNINVGVYPGAWFANEPK
jgi:hypothetical protein